MQFFTDIILSIDETPFKDKGTLKNIVESRKDCYSYEKKGSCYRVKGTFEQLHKLVRRCQRATDHHSTATHGRTGQHSHHASTRVKSVEVSRVVMDYINKKCDEKLGKILGNCSLVPVPQSDITARITFRPQSDSFRQAAFVRQRFITFYQRVASDLHIISVPGDLHEQNKLQRKFPTLIFEPSNNKLTVMGPFPHIAEFKEFLWKNRSTKRLVSKTPTDSLSNRISASSSTHKDPDDESCPICMETIVRNKKKTLRCKHSFCSDCLETAFVYKPVCPTCGELYGTLKGTQPDGGTMEVTKNTSPLPGYEKYGTIVIHYYIPRGIQKVRVQIQGHFLCDLLPGFRQTCLTRSDS